MGAIIAGLGPVFAGFIDLVEKLFGTFKGLS